jgi:hypothetical protein
MGGRVCDTVEVRLRPSPGAYSVVTCPACSAVRGIFTRAVAAVEEANALLTDGY